MIMNFKVKINKRAAENRQRKVMYCVVFNRGHNFCCISPFCTLMLHQTRRKRHLISSPPPPQKKKNGLFFWGGGVIFLEYFHEFLGLGHKKNFGKTLGQSQCFGIIIGHFRPFCDFGKFKKSRIFSIFGQIWQLFFSKYNFGLNWP